MNRLQYCKWGHPFTDDNTYVHQKTGWKQCLRCKARRQREYRERVKQSKPCDRAWEVSVCHACDEDSRCPQHQEAR